MAPKADAHLTEETRFQAVLVAENFNSTLDPITIDEPLVLLPLANTPLLDYSLDWLQRCSVDETIIYCHAHHHSEKIREHCRKWSCHGNSMKVAVVASENCSSLGDALRDLYSKSLLKSDFLLLTGDVIGNLDLKSLLDKHKKMRNLDKSMIMSCVYLHNEEKEKRMDLSSTVNIISNSPDGKILHHNRQGKNSKISIPVDTIQGYPQLRIYPNLKDPNIAICSEVIPPLFADNFDYGTRDSLVQGVIEQEDLLGYTIRSLTLNKGFATRITSFKAYQDASEAVMKRYNYPCVPERSSSSHKIRYAFDPFSLSYSDSSASFSKKSLGSGTIIDAATNVHPNAHIENSVIGKHCDIGDGVTIRNSFIMNNVKIESNCNLDTNFIGNESTLLTNVRLERGAVIGSHVILGPDITIPKACRLMSQSPIDPYTQEASSAAPDKSICGAKGRAYIYTRDDEVASEVVWGLDDVISGVQDDHESSLSDAEISEGEEIHDDIPSDEEREQEFVREVKESLLTAFKEKSAPENVILEINSSRHAYNVPMEDVLTTIIKEILYVGEEGSEETLSGKELWSCIKDSLTAFQELLSHYIKKQRDQLLLLHAIEEKADEDMRYLPLVQNILLKLNQEMEILDDAVVIFWYEEYKQHTKAFPSIAKSISKFVEWLKESSEEEDE